jgi:bifunctional pyridoxal-dependent enzyme with beta-cystathionase and maltose regulon repressor activities
VAGCPAALSGRESAVYRAGIKQRFSETELAAAGATYLAWIDLRPLNIDDRALQKVLIEQQKVAIMPGYTYGKKVTVSCA